MTDTTTDVRALTLINPWAHAIAHLGKRVENRTWAPRQPVRLYIHAGARWDTIGAVRLRLDPKLRTTAPASAIVATADLVSTCTRSRTADTVVCDCGPWAQPHAIHWHLRSVVPLYEPVPCRGALGLWRPPADVIEAIEAQPCPHLETFRHYRSTRETVDGVVFEHNTVRCQQCRSVLDERTDPVGPVRTIDHLREVVVTGGGAR
jgi:hypothetical protein